MAFQTLSRSSSRTGDTRFQVPELVTNPTDYGMVCLVSAPGSSTCVNKATRLNMRQSQGGWDCLSLFSS